MNDPLSDMLTRIRNAQLRGKSSVSMPSSKLLSWVLDVLESEGYIRDYKLVDIKGNEHLEIRLKYFDNQPVIKELKRISKPGRRVYSGAKVIPKVRHGLGIAIVSTPRGIMSDSRARAANIGGEVLCTVF